MKERKHNLRVNLDLYCVLSVLKDTRAHSQSIVSLRRNYSQSSHILSQHKFHTSPRLRNPALAYFKFPVAKHWNPTWIIWKSFFRRTSIPVNSTLRPGDSSRSKWRKAVSLLSFHVPFLLHQNINIHINWDTGIFVIVSQLSDCDYEHF